MTLPSRSNVPSGAPALAGWLLAIVLVAPLPVLGQDPAASSPARIAPAQHQSFPEGTPSLEERLTIEPVEDTLGVYGRDGADTRIELYNCGTDELCGRIVWLRRLAEDDGSVRKDLKNPDPDLQSRELMGMKVLWGLERKGKGGDRWVRGRIYNPDDGKDYKAHLAFRDDEAVELEACIFLLCKTQVWEPIKDAPVPGTAVSDVETGTGPAQSSDSVSQSTESAQPVE